MSFCSRISKAPNIYDAERAKEIVDIYSGETSEVLEVLRGAGSCSPFLHGLLMRNADWLREAISGTPEKVLPDLYAGLNGADAKTLKVQLRQAKSKVALFTALADLAGVWSLDEVTAALTDFADLSVGLMIRTLVSAQIDRGKLPGQGQDDKASCGGLCVLAMGKMGAHELNYSSDIDLISLFDESRYEIDDLSEVRSVFIRVTRDMAAALSELTGDGYVFRTDLRLRPDPSVTPVCLSMAAAESYYESVGRTWERAAHIKARACAGDIRAGQKYLQRLRPFIWRKHLDFAAIRDAHDMRLRIREHKGMAERIVLEGHNMKLGAGGIREIEFFTQTRQMISGGRDPELRQIRTLDALDALAGKGWVPAEAQAVLSQAYVLHRQVEHRVQMVHDAQTHDLPKNAEGFERLAALSGMSVEQFRHDVFENLRAVQDLTEEFFASETKSDLGPEISRDFQKIVDRWQSYPALRSPRAAEIFGRIMPDLLAKFTEAERPDEAINHFDQFLVGLPAGVQVFSLFEANPQLVDLIVEITTASPYLASYLGQNSAVFDAVIGGSFFAEWPGADELCALFVGELAEHDHYEDKLVALRRVRKEWHFRIGVHLLRGLIDPATAGKQYADLAGAVIRTLWPIVKEEFARKHGPCPGRGAVILGMGSLGSEMLNAGSDLDLIVIYDPQSSDASIGPKPLMSRVYYARLTQSLVTALSAPMAGGRLYEVDMRLRPSGRQGPVATSWQSYMEYQRNEAWTWEHLALTRARVVAGSDALASEVEALRNDIVGADRKADSIIADTQDMRNRLFEHEPSGAGIKTGPGKMMDIALFAQSAALSAGGLERDIHNQLGHAEKIGWITSDELARLRETYSLIWGLQAIGRLISGEGLDLKNLGKAALTSILRVTDVANEEELAQHLAFLSGEAARIIDKAFDAHAKV